MAMKQLSRGSWAILPASAALMLAAATLRADLAASSPFMPANVAAAGAANGPAGPIELRGISSTSDGEAFCIYDTAKKKNVWVGLNETGNEFVVKSSDPSSDSVSVQYQGRIMKLTLRTSKVASAGMASQAAVAPESIRACAPESDACGRAASPRRRRPGGAPPQAGAGEGRPGRPEWRKPAARAQSVAADGGGNFRAPVWPTSSVSPKWDLR